jgi:hypothetical protein
VGRIQPLDAIVPQRTALARLGHAKTESHGRIDGSLRVA